MAIDKNPIGRPLKFQSPEELQEKINQYFLTCEEGEEITVYDKKKQELVTYTRKIPYTITGLALALDTSRKVLMEYQGKDNFSNTVKKAKLLCENYAELRLLYGDIPPASAIFALKNYGWVDKTETDLNIKSIEDALKEIHGDG